MGERNGGGDGGERAGRRREAHGRLGGTETAMDTRSGEREWGIRAVFGRGLTATFGHGVCATAIQGGGVKAVARRHEPAYRGRRRSRVVCSGGLPNGGHVSRRWCDGGGVHLAAAGMWYRRRDRPCFATEVVLWSRLAAGRGPRAVWWCSPRKKKKAASSSSPREGPPVTATRWWPRGWPRLA
ncbi:aldo/keto reductase [Sesbania bispinosa]|nr:aldo/keto reductase [Sesbania bispinosa]